MYGIFTHIYLTNVAKYNIHGSYGIYVLFISIHHYIINLLFVGDLWVPSKIEWDLTNGPLRKLLELLDSQVEGSVQWVLFEISWIGGTPFGWFHIQARSQSMSFTPLSRSSTNHVPQVPWGQISPFV